MKLEILKCPSCGANIEFEEGVEYCECEYCGAKVTVAPSLESKNNVVDTFREISPPINSTAATKAKRKNSPNEGSSTKFIKAIFNALFIMNLFFAGLSVIMAIDDGGLSMVFAALFALVYAIMFRVLALTPKGSKHILGKEKGIKPVYFVLICVLFSFLMIALSPSSDNPTDANVGTTEQTVISEQTTE